MVYILYFVIAKARQLAASDIGYIVDMIAYIEGRPAVEIVYPYYAQLKAQNNKSNTLPWRIDVILDCGLRAIPANRHTTLEMVVREKEPTPVVQHLYQKLGLTDILCAADHMTKKAFDLELATFFGYTQ